MKAANIMAGHTEQTDAEINDVVEAKDRAIRLAAFEAIGKFATALLAFRDAIYEEEIGADVATVVCESAGCALMFLSPALQQDVSRALGIVDARNELAEVFGSRRHGSVVDEEIEILAATMMVRDLVGLPAKKAWPVCACGTQSKDVRWHNDYSLPPKCWDCYQKSKPAPKPEPTTDVVPF